MGVTTISTVRDTMSSLRGRLFMTIEAAGLDDLQETAIKGLIRTATYDAQTTLEAAIRKLGDDS